MVDAVVGFFGRRSAKSKKPGEVFFLSLGDVVVACSSLLLFSISDGDFVVLSHGDGVVGWLLLLSMVTVCEKYNEILCCNETEIA